MPSPSGTSEPSGGRRGSQALANDTDKVEFGIANRLALTSLSPAELSGALVEGREDLAAAAGTPVNLLAYPHGQANAGVLGVNAPVGKVVGPGGRVVPETAPNPATTNTKGVTVNPNDPNLPPGDAPADAPIGATAAPDGRGHGNPVTSGNPAADVGPRATNEGDGGPADTGDDDDTDAAAADGGPEEPVVKGRKVTELDGMSDDQLLELDGVGAKTIEKIRADAANYRKRRQRWEKRNGGGNATDAPPAE